MQIILIIAYPVVLHLGVVLEQPMLMLLAMSFLSLGLSYRGVLRLDPVTLGVIFLINSVFFCLFWFDLVSYIVLLPPLIVPILLSFTFGRTLLPDSIPLVTDIGDRARGPLSDEMRTYTRHITEAWTLIFALLFLEALMLTIWTSLETWSWFTNLINHLFVGGMFLGEFILRKKLFPTHDHPGFLDYLRIVMGHRFEEAKS